MASGDWGTITHFALKSDYFRIEMHFSGGKGYHVYMLKSDYFRIEMLVVALFHTQTIGAKIRLF